MKSKDQAWEPRHRNRLQSGFKGSDIQHKSFFDQSHKQSLQRESSQPEQRQQWLGLRCWCRPMNILGLQIERESVSRQTVGSWLKTSWDTQVKQDSSSDHQESEHKNLPAFNSVTIVDIYEVMCSWPRPHFHELKCTNQIWYSGKSDIRSPSTAYG